jgi:hypothetical protein
MANLLAPPRRYEYRMYRSGRYLGLLPQPENDFQYTQDLNTPGTALTLQLRIKADLQNEQPDYLTTEAAEYLLTEAGEYMIADRQPDIVGNANSNALIRNNNTIIVYEYSTFYPNGIIVFQGWVSRWKAKYASGEDLVTVSCISNGSELDNYLIQGSSTLDLSQTTSGSNVPISEYASDKLTTWARVGETFTPTAGTNLAAIGLRLAADDASYPCTVTVKIWNSVSDFSSGTPLATTTQVITSTTPAEYTFTFSIPPTMNVAQSYFFTVQCSADSGAAAEIYYSSSDLYAAGTYYRSVYTGTSGGSWIAQTGDLYFKTYYSASATSAPYTSTDPTTILKSIIDAYVSRGGSINYSSTSTTLTGVSRSYTFKVNTILQGIKKCRELAPYNYYWFVHPATNIIYFLATSATAQHTFVLGNHIFELELEASTEEVKNQVYFSGGDVGSNVYLYTSLSDSTALAANAGRVGLELLSDNRVTLSDTALALMQNFISGNSAEKYYTTLTISADSYDITTINLGQTVGFGGYGNFIDSLVLQIVQLERHGDYVILHLGALPKRFSTRVEEIDRQLSDVQTIYNPTSPS